MHQHACIGLKQENVAVRQEAAVHPPVIEIETLRNLFDNLRASSEDTSPIVQKRLLLGHFPSVTNHFRTPVVHEPTTGNGQMVRIRFSINENESIFSIALLRSFEIMKIHTQELLSTQRR